MYKNSSYSTMSGPRMNMNQMNGNGRRPPPNLNKVSSSALTMESNNKSSTAQHDELIRYICESWNKVSQEIDKNTGTSVLYYQRENTNLKDFEPFNLEEFWGRRVVQNRQHAQQHS